MTCLNFHTGVAAVIIKVPEKAGVLENKEKSVKSATAWRIHSHVAFLLP